MTREPISSEKQKDILLQILEYIDEICVEHDIKYSLCGGTLIGAIRHKGFIPWDDDIDIMLERTQYEKLISVLKKDNQYYLLDKNTSGYRKAYAKLCDKRTYAKSYSKVPIEMGIFVDIFPVDNIPDSQEEEKKFKNKIAIKDNNAYYSRITTYNGASSLLKVFLKTIICFPLYVKSRINGNMYTQVSQLESYSQKYNNQKTKFCGCLTSSCLREKEKYPREIFNSYSKVLFEGKYFSSITEYDIYLKQLYNNYMALPPEGDRINHDFYKWYWKE
ncbi:LicD family protein [Enterococcus nangangensis]|uniref:LicD family protein n=1 Tax=Enterococcus nangangensis TaxID=2559926 RepID=UPI00148550E1|nr:LicD family protein [Enterococcus nangangensis]